MRGVETNCGTVLFVALCYEYRVYLQSPLYTFPLLILLQAFIHRDCMKI